MTMPLDQPAPSAQPAAPAERSAPAEKSGDISRRRPVVVITGMSGAGLSTALKCLEDLGYEAVDNLPMNMIETLVGQDDLANRPVAITVDARTRHFSADSLMARIDALAARPDLKVRLAFLDCGDEILQRRYTETRRRHPLAIDRPVADGILRERTLLEALKERADVSIDTSLLSIHDLRRILAGQLHLAEDVFVERGVLDLPGRERHPDLAPVVAPAG